jgi:hypothetical protein
MRNVYGRIRNKTVLYYYISGIIIVRWTPDMHMLPENTKPRTKF